MNSLQEIGELLKTTREKKGLTLDKVYKKTRIYPGVLKSLEEGNTEGLSSKIYAKAFLKRYAEFLDLDKEEIASLYEKLYPEEKETSFYIDKEEETTGRDTIKYLNIALRVFIVMFFVTFALVSISRIRLFLSNRMKKIVSTEPVSEKKEKPQPKPEKKTEVPRPSNIILSVKTADEAWMQIKKDGEIVFTGILPKGSKESWTANERIDLRTGKLEAITFIVNNKEIGKLGSGVKDITIDKEGIKIGRKRLPISSP